MRVKSLLLVLALFAASSCDYRCSGGNLITLTTPEPIELFEVRDKNQVLWQIKTANPKPIGFLRYGEVPPGFQQVIPTGSARPRPFIKDEVLYKKTVTVKSIFDHEGIAGGPASFCGGYYQSSPRKSHRTNSGARAKVDHVSGVVAGAR